jgi:large exoprotein involved in heme utilization and adhesion
VTVTATDTLTLGAFASGIFATAEGADVGAGAAGSIVVTAPRIMVTEGAGINSSTSGPGAGGSITVMATDTVDIAGQASALSASTAGQGPGGDVLLQARQVRLTDGATVSAESTGPGNAGNVTIAAADTFLSTNGSVVTRATQADGGNIQITASNFLRLRDSRITAEVGGGPQTVGGNIVIDPQFVILQNSQIVANAFAGQGGNIRITAGVFLADPASQVSASSALGINGQVNIQAPVTSLSGAVAPLPQAFAQTTELLRSRCVERLREGMVSRFVLGGRDGVPLEPGSLLQSPLQRMDQETGVQTGQRQPQHPESQPAWVSSAQAHAREGWEGECARWIGQPGPSGSPKRRR